MKEEALKRLTVGVAGSALKTSREMANTFQKNFKSTLNGTFPNLIESTNVDILIMFNHNQKIYNEYILDGGSVTSAILIRTEPESVFPAQYKKNVVDSYGLIISPGRVIPGMDKSISVNWPYDYSMNPLKPESHEIELLENISSSDYRQLFKFDNWERRPITISMVASNKVSPIKNSNYSVRRFFASHSEPEILRVFGQLWEYRIFSRFKYRCSAFYFALRSGIMPNIASIFGKLFERYPTFIGPIENKHTIVKNSKFSLVIENDNFYMSEKILDAIANGSVPLYVGPELKSSTPLFDLVYSISPEENLRNFLTNFDDKSIKNWQKNALEFLCSHEFRSKFTQTAVFGEIISILYNYINIEVINC